MSVRSSWSWRKFSDALQVRVRLGDCEEPPDRRGEALVRLRCAPWGAGLLERGAGACDLLEDPALVRRIRAHGLDEVGDQVGPPLQLDVDVRPAGVDLVPQPDEPVVAEDGEDATKTTTPIRIQSHTER